MIILFLILMIIIGGVVVWLYTNGYFDKFNETPVNDKLAELQELTAQLNELKGQLEAHKRAIDSGNFESWREAKGYGYSPWTCNDSSEDIMNEISDFLLALRNYMLRPSELNVNGIIDKLPHGSKHVYLQNFTTLVNAINDYYNKEQELDNQITDLENQIAERKKELGI